jgi:hypothetical protein
MPRSRRFLLPALAVFVALLLAAPASALPALSGTEAGWARILEPLFRLGRLFAPEGWSTDPNGRTAPAPAAGSGPRGLFAPEGWLIDPNGIVAPPPSESGWSTDPNG